MAKGGLQADGVGGITDVDLQMLERAAAVADRSAGLTMPHPNFGCVLVGRDDEVLAETFQYAQGTVSCEVQAVEAAGSLSQGATAYLAMEPGDCHGDTASVDALVAAGVGRVVMGMRHPSAHQRGSAIDALLRNGIRVDVLGEASSSCSEEQLQAALRKCLAVNEALIHFTTMRRPLSVLKYAMTLDGKIAATTGHSAWVSGEQARARVFELRARSDAVIVGGQTVRRDNPNLTTRRENGHTPTRIVLSRGLDLPEVANLWNVAIAPTIVCTQKGARRDFQASLRAKGVEVVEFDFLSPAAVADYCYERGFLQLLWECGGTLAAPAIAGNVIHKLMVFVAPKIIGGPYAPTPIGELGFVEMTQALRLVETETCAVGPDMQTVGYLASTSGGLARQALLLAGQGAVSSGANAERGGVETLCSLQPEAEPGTQWCTRERASETVVEFYKAWDRYGALSNFSYHPVSVPSSGGALREWASVEHFYQASKFGADGATEPLAKQVVEEIAAAASPEEAARIGRLNERQRPELRIPGWVADKVGVMRVGLAAKFRAHSGPRALLLDTAGAELVEASPHDFFWGCGIDGRGQNRLGEALMELREELLQEHGDEDEVDGGASTAATGPSADSRAVAQRE